MKGYSHWAQVAMLVLWAMAGTGCETNRYTIDYTKHYPSAQQPVVDKPAVVWEVEDAIPDEDFRKAQNFLGEDMLRFMVSFPILYMSIHQNYSADQPRTQLVRSTLQGHFSAAGLPSLDLSGQKPGQFIEGVSEALSVSVRVKKLAVTTSFSSAVPMLIINIVSFHYKQVDVVLECKVTQPGNQTALWKGTLSGKADSRELEQLEDTAGAKIKDSDAWMVHEAIDRAVQGFVTQSQVVQIAAHQRHETFSKAMKAARDTEAGGNLRTALTHYGRAYQAADSDTRELDTIKAVAHVSRTMKGQLTFPEEARRYGVQATLLAEKKLYAEATSLYRQALGIAPWWAEGHFNRALLCAQQSRLSDAITAMKAYLELSPNGSDARAAQDKIYEWELEKK